MKSFRMSIASLAFTLLFATGSMVTQAGVIGFSGPDTAVVGQSLEIDLIVSGLDATGLAGFDIDVKFDPNLLSFSSYRLGAELTDPVFGQDDWSLGAVDSGVVNLSELSYLLDFSGQPNSFSIATITFDTLAAGAALFNFDHFDFTDGMGSPLQLNALNGGVRINPVPLPGVWSLLLAGLAGLYFSRKRPGTDIPW